MSDNKYNNFFYFSHMTPNWLDSMRSLRDVSATVHQLFQPTDTAKRRSWKTGIGLALSLVIGASLGFMFVFTTVLGPWVPITAAFLIKLTMASGVVGLLLGVGLPEIAKRGWLDKLFSVVSGILRFVLKAVLPAAVLNDCIDAFKLSPPDKKAPSFRDNYLGVVPAFTLYFISNVIHMPLKVAEIVLDILSVLPRKAWAWATASEEFESLPLQEPEYRYDVLTEEEITALRDNIQGYTHQHSDYDWVTDAENAEREPPQKLLTHQMVIQRTAQILLHLGGGDRQAGHTLIQEPPLSFGPTVDSDKYVLELSNAKLNILDQVVAGIVPSTTTVDQVDDLYKGLKAIK
ncbi:MAG: hypothetical protein DHS20C10_14440 [marine bacterium B5-7]|nr:MAG: hypothetical protein DHS20C10_14440 [marine bacterium B5-7]